MCVTSNSQETRSVCQLALAPAFCIKGLGFSGLHLYLSPHYRIQMSSLTFCLCCVLVLKLYWNCSRENRLVEVFFYLFYFIFNAASVLQEDVPEELPHSAASSHFRKLNAAVLRCSAWPAALKSVATSVVWIGMCALSLFLLHTRPIPQADVSVTCTKIKWHFISRRLLELLQSVRLSVPQGFSFASHFSNTHPPPQKKRKKENPNPHPRTHQDICPNLGPRMRGCVKLILHGSWLQRFWNPL